MAMLIIFDIYNIGAEYLSGVSIGVMLLTNVLILSHLTRKAYLEGSSISTYAGCLIRYLISNTGSIPTAILEKELLNSGILVNCKC